MRRLVRYGGLALAAAAVVAWVFTLRPQALGGPAEFIAVRGSSMLPTFQHGDLVVVESAANYQVGEVVAYRVPAREVGEGKIVIHRIVGGDAMHGFTMQGDHNSAPDPWAPMPSDVVGVASLRIPNAGRVIELARQPVILGGLAAAVMVTFVLARPPRPRPAARRGWRLRRRIETGHSR